MYYICITIIIKRIKMEQTMISIRFDYDISKIKSKLESKAKKSGFVKKSKKGNINAYLKNLILDNVK